MQRKRWFGPLVIIIKIGPKLFGLLKGAKFIKFGLFGASAATYTIIFSWKVAIMILILLFLHEGGHLWAMRRRGMKIKGMYFIPFLGAAAVADDDFPSREAENYVALMGPTVGLFVSALAYAGFIFTNELEFAAAAGWMALVNLINLLPVMPLDGGRVLRSITFSFGSGRGMWLTIAGMAVGMIVMWQMKIWLFLILIPIGLLEIIGDLRRTKVLLDEQKSLREAIEIDNDAIKILNNFTHPLNDLEKQFKEDWERDKQDCEAKLKAINIKPRMSLFLIFRGIIWTLILAVALFAIIYYAAAVTGDQSVLEILK